MNYRQQLHADPNRIDLGEDYYANVTPEDKDAHIAWMLDEIEKHCWDWTELAGQDGVWTDDKKMRWLGFIQGYLWATGLRPINLMRADNMGEAFISPPSYDIANRWGGLK